MVKKQVEHKSDSNGTPTYVLLSIIFAILIFALEGFKASVGLGEEMQGGELINIAFVALGLALCFFWKRLTEGRLRLSAAVSFSVGIWLYLMLMVGGQLASGQELAHKFVLQFGFGAIMLSSSILLAAVFFSAKQLPSLTLACIAGLLTTVASVWSLLPISHRSGKSHEDFSARSHHDQDLKHAEDSEEGEEIHSSQFEHDRHEQDSEAEETQAHEREHAPIKGRKTAEPSEDKPKFKLSARADVSKGSSAHSEPVKKQKGAKPPEKLAHAVNAKAHWDYEGDRGPEAWGDLSPDFKLCSEGIEQSPIDIAANWPVSDKLETFYRPSGFELVDNGHTVQINIEPGNFIMIGPARYELKQVHFHTPSEHFFNGRSSILEAHFVHASSRGELAVLGSMIEPGLVHREYQKIWNFLPSKVNEPVKARGKLFDPRALLPKDLIAFTYPGSLTTPPCSEKVKWNVLREPVQMSQDQINRFRAKYRLNARPIQPLNER